MRTVYYPVAPGDGRPNPLARSLARSRARAIATRGTSTTVVARLARSPDSRSSRASRFRRAGPELRDTARTFYKVVGTRESAPRRRRDTRESGAARTAASSASLARSRASFSLPPLPSSVPSLLRRSTGRFVLFLSRPLAPPVYYVSVILFTLPTVLGASPSRSNAGAHLTATATATATAALIPSSRLRALTVSDSKRPTD